MPLLLLLSKFYRLPSAVSRSITSIRGVIIYRGKFSGYILPNVIYYSLVGFWDVTAWYRIRNPLIENLCVSLLSPITPVFWYSAHSFLKEVDACYQGIISMKSERVAPLKYADIRGQPAKAVCYKFYVLLTASLEFIPINTAGRASIINSCSIFAASGIPKFYHLCSGNLFLMYFVYSRHYKIAITEHNFVSLRSVHWRNSGLASVLFSSAERWAKLPEKKCLLLLQIRSSLSTNEPLSIQRKGPFPLLATQGTVSSALNSLSFFPWGADISIDEQRIGFGMDVLHRDLKPIETIASGYCTSSKKILGQVFIDNPIALPQQKANYMGNESIFFSVGESFPNPPCVGAQG